MTALACAVVLLVFAGFLHLPIQPQQAYGGSLLAGACALVGGWLYALHVVVLVGYVLTLQLQTGKVKRR